MKYRWIRGGDISSWNQTSFKSNCRYHCKDLRKILFAIESIVFSWKTFTTSTHRSPHAGSAADDDERRDEEEKLILRCGIALAHVEIKLAWKALKTILWELWRGVVPGIRFGGEWEKNFYRFSQIFHFFMEFVPEQLTTLPPTAFGIVGLLLPEHCKEHAHIHTQNKGSQNPSTNRKIHFFPFSSAIFHDGSFCLTSSWMPLPEREEGSWQAKIGPDEHKHEHQMEKKLSARSGWIKNEN